MKATALLKAQHKEVSALFAKIEKASPAEKRPLFEELAGMLVAHDAIEREIFYPAVERKLGMIDVLGEALVEHGVVEFNLYEADESSKDDFGFKMTVLKEMVEHHVEEEEEDLLPKVEKAFSAAALETLGTQMKERFDEAVDEDFRAPLHRNLKQVLAGAIKPGTKGAKAKAKSAPKKTTAKNGAAKHHSATAR